jgi:iron complex outermembrane receptor protein
MKCLNWITCLFLIGALHAQRADTIAFLPETTIQANRIQEQALESGKGILILDRKDIEAMPARTIQEALQYISGVHIDTRSFAHVQADVSIRGGSFDQVLLLVDGIKLNDVQTGHHNMNIPVPLEMVERIEVIKGPGARIYGPNAFAGVINIITKSDPTPNLTAKYYGGGFNSHGGALSLSHKTGKVQHQLSARRDQSEGFRYNTDYTVQQLFYKAKVDLNRHQLTFQGAYTDRKFGANGFYADTSFNDQYEEIQSSYAAFQHQYNGNSIVLRSNIYWRRNQDIYLFIRNDPEFYRNFHLGNNIGAESNLQWINSWGQSGFGIDARREILRSNLLGDRERDVLAVSAEHRFDWNSLSITPGLVYNYYSDHGSTILPGIEATYRLTDYTTLLASTGRTFRVPTYTDLYYVSPAELGNPNLVAETAWSSEIGIRHLNSQWDVQYTFFHRRVSDLIDWRREENIWNVANLTQALHIFGQEAAVRWRPSNSTSNKVEIEQISSQITLLHPLQNIDENSRYNFNMLNLQWVNQLSFSIHNNFRFRPSLRWMQPNSAAQTDLQTANYFLADVNMAYKWRKSELFVEAINILDTEVYGPGGVLLPGRWIRAGVNFSLDLEKQD